MAKVRTIILSLLMALFAIVGLATPVLAIDEPTSVSLDDIVIFKDLLVTGDFLAVVPYNIAFGTAPDANVDKTFIFRLMSPDGSTEIGSTLAYPAYNGGYGSGLVSFYFASGMTWGSAYIVRVQENPTYYPGALYWDFVSTNATYSGATDQAAALKTKIIDSATLLSIEYLVPLLSASESGSTVLSAAGELYYLEAIPGLQSMCTDLFQVQLENPDYTRRTWSTAFADALRVKYSGTFLYEAMTGFGGLYSVETNSAMTFLSIILCVILIGLSVWKFKASMLSATTDGYAFLLLLMLQGVFPMVAAGGLAFIAVVIGGIILFLNKS